MAKRRNLTPDPRAPKRLGAEKTWRRIYLREWRLYRGLSVEGLAAKAGVSPAQISLIENQKSAGSPDSLEKLAKALDCEVGELLDIKPEPGGRVMRFWVPEENQPFVADMAASLSRLKGKPK